MQEIKMEDLRAMGGKEGLIIQGCGGELADWVDGINQILQEEGILPSEEKLDQVYVFRNADLTNLLFLFGEQKLNYGKLAVWRLQSHNTFGGTWLTDYVENRLGGFLVRQENEKPKCPLIGENGNIFNLLGIASRTLKESGRKEQAEEMCRKVMGGGCGSYHEALKMIEEYVEIVSVEDMTEKMEIKMG